MTTTWVFLIAIVLFFGINLTYYYCMKTYVQTTFGRNWLQFWNNKLYFWQSAILVSSGGTVLLLILLKWFGILTF
ncbi:MAG: hypothetical protein OIF50_17400 [Flavobacteriaceae bacterium]|nr:hypothetical protein [Flavobacteriaceae bacterium]